MYVVVVPKFTFAISSPDEFLLLYGLESVSPSKSQLRFLNNCINRAVYKIFDVNDAVCVNDLRCFVGLHDVEELVERRRLKFVDRLIMQF